mgnify:CR=1 FL=1
MRNALFIFAIVAFTSLFTNAQILSRQDFSGVWIADRKMAERLGFADYQVQISESSSQVLLAISYTFRGKKLESKMRMDRKGRGELVRMIDGATQAPVETKGTIDESNIVVKYSYKSKNGDTVSHLHKTHRFRLKKDGNKLTLITTTYGEDWGGSPFGGMSGSSSGSEEVVFDRKPT